MAEPRARRDESGRRLPGLLTLNNTATTNADRNEIYEKVIRWLQMPNLTPEHRLNALRTFEIASWDRIGGAPVAVRSRVRDILLAQFESQNARLEMDMGKVLVYTGTNAGMPFENQTGTPNNISLRSPSMVAANTRIIDLLLNAMPARDTSAQMEYV